MSKTAEFMAQCTLLEYPKQVILSDRYFAEPVPGLGIIVFESFFDEQMSGCCLQAFPVPFGVHTDLYDCYLSYGSRLEAHNFKKYKYYPNIHDVLTLSALVADAIHHWRNNP